MKVLLVNKFFYLKGGAEKNFFEIGKLLKEKGNQIIYFSTKSKFNNISKFNKYFTKFKKVNYIYSFKAKRKIKKLIEKYKPDIAHLHNIYFHITPSIIHTLKKYKVPIVMTLHDYKLLCHNYYFYNFKTNKICKNCIKGKHIKCFCYKNIPKDLAFKLEFLINSKILKIYNYIDYYIAPSNFIRKIFIKEGFKKEKIFLLRNFIEIREEPRWKKGDYILFLGRLSQEKGALIIPKLAKLLPKIKFKIAGDGPLKKEIFKYAKTLKNLEYLGFKTERDLKDLIDNSRFLIFPSLWYENCPYAILETFSRKKTVIASNLGGIPEIVSHNKNGILINPYKIKDLAYTVKFLYENEELLRNLGEEAFKTVKQKFNKEKFYKKLIKIYKNAKI